MQFDLLESIACGQNLENKTVVILLCERSRSFRLDDDRRKGLWKARLDVTMGKVMDRNQESPLLKVQAQTEESGQPQTSARQPSPRGGATLRWS